MSIMYIELVRICVFYYPSLFKEDYFVWLNIIYIYCIPANESISGKNKNEFNLYLYFLLLIKLYVTIE